MDEAIEQISHYQEFDYLIINDQFAQTLTELKSLILTFRLRQTLQCQHHKELIESLLV
jgi:guanylate kinase